MTMFAVHSRLAMLLVSALAGADVVTAHVRHDASGVRGPRGTFGDTALTAMMQFGALSRAAERRRGQILTTL
ncbi:MAG: hypothetical protein ACLUHE_17055 [Christensenellales bacterium]